MTKNDPCKTMPGSLPATAQTRPMLAQIVAASSAAPSESACSSSRCGNAVIFLLPLAASKLREPEFAILDRDQRNDALAVDPATRVTCPAAESWDWQRDAEVDLLRPSRPGRPCPAGRALPCRRGLTSKETDVEIGARPLPKGA